MLVCRCRVAQIRVAAASVLFGNHRRLVVCPWGFQNRPSAEVHGIREDVLRLLGAAVREGLLLLQTSRMLVKPYISWRGDTK